jgi:hypothetical protein
VSAARAVEPTYVIRPLMLRIADDLPHYMEGDFIVLLEKMAARGYEYVDGMSGPIRRGTNHAGVASAYVPILFRRVLRLTPADSLLPRGASPRDGERS